MRVILTILAGALSLALGATSGRGPDPLPPAQQMNMHALWDSFFQGCTDGNEGTEYLCACAGTYLIDKCTRQGIRNEAQFGVCVQDQRNIQEATSRCLTYGRLGNGGAVQPPPAVARPAPEPATAARTTRLDRWVGSYRGCTTQATPAERQRAPSISYTCACFATYIVNTCAPADDTTNDYVQSCIGAIGNDRLERAALACDQYGSMRPR